MGYSYNINSQKKDKSSSSFLFICHPLGAVVTTFVSTFLVAYIFQFSKDTFDYVFNVGVYYICVYATFLLTYWFFSMLTDRTNRVWIYRASQLIRLAFILLIIFYGQKLAQMLPLAGFLYGLSEACYYGSYNVLKQEMVSRKVMSKFSILITIATKSMDIIVPVTLGALIHVSTYEQTSIYVAVILGIITLLSFGIKSKKPEGSSFSLKEYFKKLKEHPKARERIMFIYKASFVYGFTTITNNLLSICIMLQFGSSLSLGSITSIIGAVTIVEIMLVTKFTKPAQRNWLYAIAILLPIISSVLFVITSSYVTVIIFNLLMNMSKIIFSAIFDIYRNSTLKEAGLYSEISEHQTMVESLLSIARVLSFGIMILVGLLKNLVVFEILLVVFSLSYSGVNLCLMIYEKKFLKLKHYGVIEPTEKQQEKNFQYVLSKLKKDW